MFFAISASWGRYAEADPQYARISYIAERNGALADIQWSALMAEVIGIDHIYVTVSDLAAAEQFYDRVMIGVLAFRKNKFSVAGDPHVQYFNRHFGFVLRPSRAFAKHDPYSPGLHHFCLRVDSAADVHTVANQLRALGIDATEPRLYPEYASDYAATFFEGPDGIRLEVTNYRQERRERHDHWHHAAS